MTDMPTQIEKLRLWGSSRRAWHRNAECPFLLSCTFVGSPVPASELADLHIDPGLKEFWMNSRSADLFKDDKFGQWGLRILSPAEAESETGKQRVARPRDFPSSDLVIGRFIGDSEILVLDTSHSNRCGNPVIVALPLDSRADWPVVADSFSEFLSKLIDAEGSKYWSN